MKKNTMFWCGIALIILSLFALIKTTDPAAIGRYWGGIGAGIILTIIGYKKSQKTTKGQTNETK